MDFSTRWRIRRQAVAKSDPGGDFVTRRGRGRTASNEIPPDAAAARVAKAQHGAVSTGQLVAAGMSWGAIEHRVETGRLVRRHRGVYVMGPVTGPLCDEHAAILACGAGAWLSDDTALALYALAERPAEVHVTRRAAVRHHGIRGHRRSVEPCDRAERHGLPVTAPARTLLDVAASMPALELARLVEEAQVRRLVSRRQLADALRRGRHRPGAAALRNALARDDEPSFTRSEGERRLLALVRAARLPAPRANARVGRWEVDALWPEHRLVVEIDGFAFHGSRAAFERDRRKDAELVALGYRVVRVTWRQLEHEPHAVIARLAAALAA